MAKKKKSAKLSKVRPKTSRDWSTLSEVQRFNRVFAIFKSVTAGGADGSIKGVNGSINAVSTKLILDSLRVNGGVVCDLGAADGKFMICAFLAGARQVLGVEFAENIGYKVVLEAVVRRMKQEYGIEFNLDWIGSAIEDVRIFSSLSLVFGYQCTLTSLLWGLALPQIALAPGEPSSVFAFWNGMSPITQNCVLELCARTSSVDSIAVFYNTNWTSPGDGTALQIPSV